jgi:hypothetical protein
LPNLSDPVRRRITGASNDNDRQTAGNGRLRPAVRDKTLTERNVLRAQSDGWRLRHEPGTWFEDKLEDQERRALGRALVERRARLIESTGDSTQTRARQRAGLLELSAIASVLRKLRHATR